jgi:hypothetical protein
LFYYPYKLTFGIREQPFVKACWSLRLVLLFN